MFKSTGLVNQFSYQFCLTIHLFQRKQYVQKVFPASDKVFENDDCLTKVALYEIRIISSIQLYII